MESLRSAATYDKTIILKKEKYIENNFPSKSQNH